MIKGRGSAERTEQKTEFWRAWRNVRTDGLGHGVGIAILVEALGEGMLLRRRSGRSDGVGGLALGLALKEGEERHFGLGEEEKVMGRIGWLKKRPERIPDVGEVGEIQG